MLGTVHARFTATTVSLVVLGLAGRRPVPALLPVVGIGVTSQVLSVALHTYLTDLSPTAPSLGAALCHSASKAGNAAGAVLGGVPSPQVRSASPREDRARSHPRGLRARARSRPSGP